MLSVLQIDNIAVIEHAEISFEAGLNVLTGETGAGKSIIIDSISAILGARTYRDLIRTGCNKASVTALFRLDQVPRWFAEHGIECGDELWIRREIYADGKNICRINDVIVSVSALKELGLYLISIHGQNDTQALFDEQTHIGYLDALMPSNAVKDEYFRRFSAYRDCYESVARLSSDSGERIRRLETLQHQIKEIEASALRDGEETELESRKRLLLNAERLSSGLNSAIAALYGDEEGSGACDFLSDAERELQKLSAVDEQFCQKSENVASLRHTLQDLVRELQDQAEDISYSEGELEQIENRLGLIKKLKMKYGSSVAEVLLYLRSAKAEAESLDLSDEELEQKKRELAALRADMLTAAQKLSDERKQIAVKLKGRMETELSQLAMPNFRFQVEFDNAEPTETGTDAVRFLMSANVGEDLRPLSKIASGGELARVMLAIENVLSEQQQIPTMIFDEVDAGVSGRAAQKVAEKLHRVSEGKQVLCVTHLAQIAAMADTHLLISKAVRDGRTYTGVHSLQHNERIDELARIIGGANITETTRKSAEEMIRQSQ